MDDRKAIKALVRSVRGQSEDLKKLLEDGADPNTKNASGFPMLYLAVKAEILDSVDLLLKFGADPNEKEPEHGYSPLYFAAKRGMTDICSRLMAANGIDIDLSCNGTTAFEIAKKKKKEEIVKLFEERHAEIREDASKEEDSTSHDDPVVIAEKTEEPPQEAATDSRNEGRRRRKARRDAQKEEGTVQIPSPDEPCSEESQEQQVTDKKKKEEIVREDASKEEDSTSHDDPVVIAEKTEEPPQEAATDSRNEGRRRRKARRDAQKEEGTVQIPSPDEPAVIAEKTEEPHEDTSIVVEIKTTSEPVATKKPIKVVPSGAPPKVGKDIVNAISNGKVEAVKEYLKTGSPDAVDMDGWRIILDAIYENQVKVVELLLEFSANPNVTVPGNGAPALYLAAEKGSLPIVKLLIKADGIDLDKANKNGVTPLAISTQNGHVECAEMILSAGAGVDIPNVEGSRPLFVACEDGRAELVKLFIKKGADVNKPNVPGSSPLHVAAQNGHTAVAKELLDAGADPNAVKPSDGDTPLIVASQNNRLGIVELLVNAKAKLHSVNNNHVSPLLIAAYNANDKVVKCLVNAGAPFKVDEKQDEAVKKVFMPCMLSSAARLDDLELLEKVIQKGGDDLDVAGADAVGRTAAEYAKQSGHTRMLNRLAAEGANVFTAVENVSKARNAGGCGTNILHGFVWKMPNDGAANWPITEQMWKDEVNAQDTRWGRTPLHHAVYVGSESWFNRLLKPDSEEYQAKFTITADPTIADYAGWTPLHEACYAGRLFAVKRLLNIMPKSELKRETFAGEIPSELVDSKVEGGGSNEDRNEIKSLLSLSMSGNPSKRSRFFLAFKRRLLYAISVLFFSFLLPGMFVNGLFSRDSVAAVMFNLGDSSSSLLKKILLILLWIAVPIVSIVVCLLPNVTIMSYIVIVAIVILFLFQTGALGRSIRDNRFWKVRNASEKVRLMPPHKYWRNFLVLFTIVLEFWQLSALPFVSKTLSFPSGSGGGRTLSEVLRGALLQFPSVIPDQISISFWITASILIVWLLLSGHLGLSAFLLHPDREKTRRKLFPFVKGNVLDSIPGKDFLINLISNLLFVTLISSAMKFFDCSSTVNGAAVLDSDSSIQCWISGGHQLYGLLMLFLLWMYIPTAAIIGLYFGEAKSELLDIKLTSIYHTTQRLVKLGAVAVTILASKFSAAILVVSIAAPLILSLLNALWKPCKNIRSINLWRGILLFAAGYSGIAMAISTAFTAVSDTPLYVLLGGWGGILMVGIVISIAQCCRKTGGTSSPV